MASSAGLVGLFGLAVTVAAFATIIGACGSKSSGGATFSTGGKDGGKSGGDGGNNQGFGGDGGSFGTTPDAGFYGADAFFAMDPPPCVCPIDGGPMNCSVDGGPGGTPMCPDDKNREGCPCPMAGVTAACWPGLRVNRNVGDCHDGVTTCEMQNESELAWGPCRSPDGGAIYLPTDSGTPAQECKCFSAGEWAIANVSPCFESEQGSAMEYAVSTYLTGMQAMCPQESSPPPFPVPSQDWSTDTLTVDCAGNFNLCFTIKAGVASTPSPNDCTVAQVCIDGQYAMKGVVQQLPPLPGWAGSDPTCATQFYTSGGYGEMTVQGTAIDCETVDNGMGGPRVFETVAYCPIVNPPANCQSGGTGMF